MSDLKQDFIKEVHAAARARYAVEVFADIARAMAIALESPFTLINAGLKCLSTAVYWFDQAIDVVESARNYAKEGK